MAKPTRWGVVSAGKVAHDFMVSVKISPPEKHQVVAVAARNADRARARAEEFRVAKHYGSYEELAKDPDVDVVYVAVIHQAQAEVSKMLLKAGKPVVVELPFTQNERDMKEVIAIAKEKNVFIMQAAWIQFNPAYRRMLEEIQKGTIGEPRLLTYSSGFVSRDHILPTSGPGGAFNSWSHYGVMFTQDIFGDRDPDKIVPAAIQRDSGIDETSNVVFLYPKNKMAVLTASAVLNIDLSAKIYGKKGNIEINDLYYPTELLINGEKISFPCPKADRELKYQSPGLLLSGQYMLDHVRDMLQQGLINSTVMSHESCLSNMRLADKCREQMGIPLYSTE